jgi:lipopolysaccharide/colanic/teichoic acid biosynthesis glycosyltransferase
MFAPSYASKRLFDLAVAGAACVAIAPVLVGISAAIWLDDRRSPFLKEKRVGETRRPFTILKFSNVHEHPDTRLGRWLRRTGIDELPQFYNVCRGEMSIVGPRPVSESDVERLGWTESAHDWRFAAKPGITGLSQLLGGRSARASERLDRLYLKRQGPFFDGQLVALSVAVNVLGKHRIRRWLR